MVLHKSVSEQNVVQQTSLRDVGQYSEYKKFRKTTTLIEVVLLVLRLLAL